MTASSVLLALYELIVGTAVFSGGVNQAGYRLPLSKPSRRELLDLIDGLRGTSGA